MHNKFPEYKQLDLVKVAAEELNFWEKDDTFKKSIETREGNETFVFFEGPPSANGMPGIHHVLARSIKDIFCRYQTLKGKQVKRKAGWDTHGLPVELGVEKELGITKEDIGVKISVEDYNKACREAVMRYTDAWNDLTHKIGYWVDLEDPYITYQSKYMESVWWLLKQIYDKGLIYKGYTIQPYSPKAGTGLSSHELNMPGTYKDVSDTTIVAQFRAKKETCPALQDLDGAVYFLAWTTTPWTLPSNTALTVGKKIEYVAVKTFNQYTFEPITVIIGKPLLKKQFGGKFVETDNPEDFANYKSEDKKIPYQILKTFTGADLVGAKYEQLLPWALPYKDADQAFRVIAGNFVTTEDGTGIVHTAATFGADDAQVSEENGVPPMLVLDDHGNPVPLVDLQGKFTSHAPEKYAGKYVKNEYYNEGEAPERSVDVEIAIQLKEENKAFNVQKYNHTYPHCWRTDKPVLYYPLDSWFIKISDKRERLVELNKTINWKPKSTGEGRFGNWLAEAKDWNLSRSRYWGIPLPIWRTEEGDEVKCIGSAQELMEEVEKAIAAGVMTENPYKDFVPGDYSEENYEKLDLHKNYVDQITLVSSTGKPMKRESDLIDVWFDSGSMPYAQWHYPFSCDKKLEEIVPADFIAEGVDQTRGWFYTLHAIATLVFDQISYKNVVSNGLVLDKNGQKMSKRLGNAIDPFETIQKYGPDATRWYMISNAQPWENLKFDLEGIEEVRRKFFGTLYNTYSFFALYANVDGFTNQEAKVPVEKRPELDRWILSELNTLIEKVDGYYSDYEPTRAARAIQEFVGDNLSNWYVRLNRRRFWKGEYSEDKIAAYQTLYEVLKVVAQLASPIAPFFSDRLYKDLTAVAGETQSVHLSDFPKADASLIDDELQERTHLAQKATSMLFSLRKQAEIKVRQPLTKVMIPALDEVMKERLESIAELLKHEVNVKEVKILSNEEAADILVKEVKPNFKSLGPKFGKDMKNVAAAIRSMSNEQINELERAGKFSLEINGETHELPIEDFEIITKDIQGWVVAVDGNLTVALDTTLTDELKAEGLARELVNRIQNLRKDAGLEVTDRINVQLQYTPEIQQAVDANYDYIANETLAEKIEVFEALNVANVVEIDDIVTKIAIQKP
ncbi:isoleucine--tRNA ligase [Ornithobacterium rhinotracheale]|uniref:isoleucine--tRNA ligase n=1 Tax=Ornithobacterium rhinotracheale TaxID=28251 RepID=UPI00129CC2E0|nr:isoleucine--tRNA ligase [Ornithobacterium rhinotracheale]MRJ08148.1 isoleucine--tRNA ligase [Ornithobacterium rhinotracheale]UOH77347.1 isoleucine--tRNA ligase [Ornithobacterium rhinotracheale]